MPPIETNLRLAVDADGGILLDIDLGKFFRVNQVGARIIQLLQRGESFESLIQKISEENTAEIEVVRVDAEEFLRRLREHGLVRTLPIQKPGNAG